MVSHFRRGAIGLLLLYWLALFVGTHVPVTLEGMGQNGDKVLHFLAYSGLAFLMCLGIGGCWPTWRTFAVVLAATMLYAGFDEFSQLLVGRSCDFWDWVADCCGMLVGQFAYWVATVIYQSWSLKSSDTEAETA